MGFFLLPPAKVSYTSERGEARGTAQGGVWGQEEGDGGAEAVK